MLLHTCLADPAGNLTLFVLDPVSSLDRPALAAALMRQKPEVEQVGFAAAPVQGGAGRLEMMGAEFCGNACRAYGYYLARGLFLDGCHSLSVEMSGAATPVAVSADLDTGRSGASMPLPLSIAPVGLAGLDATLVEFEGITHLILPHPFDVALLRAGQDLLSKVPIDAWGVLFLAPDLSMTPVVTVRSTGTTVFEGSCGSGSVAAACALGIRAGEGLHCFSIRQPKGVLDAAATVRDGGVTAASIGGSVTLGGTAELTVFVKVG